jgi:hypothetical protein
LKQPPPRAGAAGEAVSADERDPIGMTTLVLWVAAMLIIIGFAVLFATFRGW